LKSNQILRNSAAVFPHVRYGSSPSAAISLLPKIDLTYVNECLTVAFRIQLSLHSCSNPTDSKVLPKRNYRGEVHSPGLGRSRTLPVCNPCCLMPRAPTLSPEPSLRATSSAGTCAISFRASLCFRRCTSLSTACSYLSRASSSPCLDATMRSASGTSRRHAGCATRASCSPASRVNVHSTPPLPPG